MIDKINPLNTKFSEKTFPETLEYLIKEYPGKICFSTSLGIEDQLLSYFLSDFKNDIHFFTLDTGRLFPETYELIQRTENKYKIKIKTYFPDFNLVEKMVNTKGINLFYDSIENRQECCRIRKTIQLGRALNGMKIWINGLRKEQSVTRAKLKMFEYDENYKIIKYSPLINWTEQMIWDKVHVFKVPYNPLHDKGYPSIGCKPCTRAIEKGEDVRAGRWWWENPEMKECGLHKK